MKYNTEEKPIRMREYGRHIQEAVERICQEPNRKKRQILAQNIYNVMLRLSTDKSSNKEKQTRVWNHLAKVSNYTLDIDYPVAIVRK